LIKKVKETPLMKQYNQIKVKYPDALLLFRVGDFYETFGADAVKASSILGIILTKRGAGSLSEIELAGFPYHSLNTYLPKLVKSGYRVAICDQLEDPKMTKTIVKRGVTELVTPGVSLNDDVLDIKKNNFLAAVSMGKLNGISFLDISTGDFWCAQGNHDQIAQLIQSFSPSEILVSKPEKKKFLDVFGSSHHCFYMDDWAFQFDTAYEKLTRHFQTNSLQGFGIEHLNEGICSAGAILNYLSEIHQNKIQHITRILPIVNESFVWLDKFTIRNLELFYPNHPEGVSLIDILDKTKTAMGARLLKHWLAFPLKEKNKILKRHNCVKAFLNNQNSLELVAKTLGQVVDIERVMAKIATEKISPRSLVQLQSSLKLFGPLKKELSLSKEKSFKEISTELLDSSNILTLLEKTLHPDAPAQLSKGNSIVDGFSNELDELRSIKASSKMHLDKMLARETKKTNIPSLKIAFNNVFGYYYEVRNTHKEKVPFDWIRKQTLVNAERYITDELKELETKILSAEDQIQKLENEIFYNLIKQLQKELNVLKVNAEVLASLDCLLCFALIAKKNNYCCPKIIDGTSFEIKGGRHPVIEKHLDPGNPYIANDLRLDRDNQQIIMITGPNMSGKSAILRQTALISLMCQIGSFVPATIAEIGIVDKIFTRVGASDNISMGASTFMVEMNETATILNNISERSLVLLDEIGRGTSTYDGISIAWAIAEYLHEHPFRPKVLFATHYHELNEMSQSFNRIKNFNVSVKEIKNKILFLRKLLPGGSAHSFGIQVAKMAGMPRHVLQSANHKLKILEQLHGESNKKNKSTDDHDSMQLSFFKLDDPILEELRDEINNLDIDTLTPVEALLELNEIKRRLEKRN
jgi:DNA mismatch repair protein MutS